MSLFITIILDGVGIGAQEDADQYNDVGSHTLGHVCETQRPKMPNMAALGLGNIEPLAGVPKTNNPTGFYGKMREVSAGKDSTTGHWEFAGLKLEEPFPTYPNGFPADMLQEFFDKTGYTKALGNKPASGTAIIDEFGAEHLAAGQPIIYTSADSVFQVAAHTDIIPPDELYRICDIARKEICIGDHGVGRVIARPFVGEVGNFKRISEKRKDFSRKPTAKPVQSILQDNNIETVAVGKISDLFAGVGFDEVRKTKGNTDGIQVTLTTICEKASAGQPVWIWVNLVDFDQEYGHRNNPSGFAAALEEFDIALPEIISALPNDAVLLISADHGNDPCYPGTDHTREFVPVLMVDKAIGNGVSIDRNMGTRNSFADHAATVMAYFNVEDTQKTGTSFLATKTLLKEQ